MSISLLLLIWVVVTIILIVSGMPTRLLWILGVVLIALILWHVF